MKTKGEQNTSIRERDLSRLLLSVEWVIAELSLVVLFGAVAVAAYVFLPTWARVVIIVFGFAVCFCGFFACVVIERKAGYYKCPHCHHKYIPTSKQVWGSMHMGRTRFLKCPKCNRKDWHKKVLD